jgi:hypothetical protein
MAKTPVRRRPVRPGNGNLRRLEGSERVLHPAARMVKPAADDEPASVSIYVRRPPAAPALPDLDYWMSHPPGHRTYLTHDEFEETHGALASDLAAVAGYCTANGLSVAESDRSRRLVIAKGTAGQVKAAFGVQLAHYDSPLGAYRGREGFVHIPPELDGIVVHVLGLDQRPLTRQRATAGLSPNAVPAGTAPAGTQSVSALYNFPSGGGSGQTVGILEFGGGYVTDSSGNPTDVNTYLGSLGLSPVTVVAVNAGASNSPAGSATNVATNDPDVEVTLDVSLVAAFAQSAKIAVYFDSNSSDNFSDCLSKAIHDKTNNPSVVSISWSGDESNFGDDARSSMQSALKDAAMLGVTVLVSSGDNGSNGDGSVNDGTARVNYPSSDPWILCCGGTQLNTASATLSETSWSGSGGGVSVKYGQQAWQDGANVPPSVNDGTTLGRGLPDISGNASPSSGYDIVIYGKTSSTLALTGGPGFNPASPGTAGPVGGTSCVAPMYAALVAIINANIGDRIGYLNPWFYTIAQQPGQLVFADVNDGASNAQTVTVSGKSVSIPGYQCGAGWDPVTGWGSIDGQQLQNKLAVYFARTCTFSMRKNTFGHDEVDVTRPSGGGDAVFPAAFMVYVDGCLPSELGINSSSDLKNPTILPQITQLPGGVAADFVGPVQATDNTLPANVPQRFTYVFNLRFTTDDAFNVTPQTVTIEASVASTSVSGTLTNLAQLTFIDEGDPFFVNSLLDKNNVAINPGWLSADLRVFTIQANQAKFGATMGGNASAAPAYIQSVIKNLTAGGGSAGGNKFDDLGLDEESSALHLFPTDSNHNLVFNFAVARVRLDGSSAAANHVRLFFRLFQAQSTGTAYVVPTPYPGNGPYRTFSDGVENGQKIPLFGIDGGEYVTIPFFAEPRIDPTSESMTAQTDDPNVQSINPIAGTEVDTFYGCYLDLNQTADGIVPLIPPATNVDGPFAAASLVSIAQTIVRSPHQCLVAEISFDVSATDIPLLPDGASYSTSDWIAQRNIAWIELPNPGKNNSRRAPQPFEVRASNPLPAADTLVDELVFDWGSTPAGSTVSIYLPAVSADAILELANTMYTHHLLKRVDDHTIQCPVAGLTYVPVPKGSVASLSYAGLLSVEVPANIVKGQVYTIVVTQVTSVVVPGIPIINVGRVAATGNNASSDNNIVWRRSIGAFQLTIPVTTKGEILPHEEALLGYLKWINETIPVHSRWYPVFQRYVGQVGGRVSGLGGDPGSIQPSPTGFQPGHHHPGHHPGHHGHGEDDHCGHEFMVEVTGKVVGLVYDRFGDFEGFVIDADCGERGFKSRESEIERLVLDAWTNRIRLTVFARSHEPWRIVSIVLRSPPSPI